MESDKSLFPPSKKKDSGLIGDSIIGIRPDESWEHAVWRHKIEQRVKKINKIKNNLSKNTFIKD